MEGKAHLQKRALNLYLMTGLDAGRELPVLLPTHLVRCCCHSSWPETDKKSTRQSRSWCLISLQLDSAHDGTYHNIFQILAE